MSTGRVIERCACGASIDFTGYSPGTQAWDFRNSHKHIVPPAPAPEPLGAPPIPRPRAPRRFVSRRLRSTP